MTKMALAIGVSDYEPGLTPLPGSAKDVEAMRRVLQNPNIGGFDEVTTLLNPEPLVMQEAIETLFSSRKKDDLVLLFFSGHGVKDDNGKLHLATRITRKTAQGELIRATAVPASFVQDIMSNSRSRRQVIILDCCFSGAFAEGWLAKDDGSVDVKSQLGGEGRAVLTSSTSTQYSFEQEGSDLSTYTRYLVEGIETGAADIDGDGVVSIDELHEYAKSKVQEAAPAMKPEIYAVKEGYKIHLAQAPTEDPKLRYRKEVEHFAIRGMISVIGRNTLDALREGLGLLPEVAAAIENEVLKPYQEYQKRLQRYKQVLVDAIQQEHSLSSDTQNELKRLQLVLKLRDEDIAQIEAQVISQKIVIPASGRLAEGIPAKPLFPKEDAATPVNSTTKALATNQAETPTSPRISFSRVSAIVPVLRNPKLLIGAGVVTAGALTFIFLVKTPQPEQRVEPAPTANPSGSSDPQTNAQDFLKRGIDKYDQKDFRGAIAEYTQAIKLNPSYAEAYNNRGNAKRSLGNNQEAIADYNESIRLKNPQLHIPYNNRGLAKSDLGDKQGAIADFNQAIKLNPSYAEAYYNRGNAKFALDNNQGALTDYNQAIQLKPDYAEAYNNRGNTKRNLGDDQEAITNFNESIRLKNPQLHLPYYNRANAKRDLGDDQGAIADYSEAIQVKPDYAEAYNNRGIAKYNLKDNQGAIADFNESIRLKNPELHLVYNNRGNAKRNLGDHQGAIADYNQAIQLKPNYAKAYNNRAIAKRNSGDKAGAIADYQKAADLYQKQGKTKESQDALEQVKELS